MLGSGLNTKEKSGVHCSTSGPNQWLEPRSILKVPYLELVNIDFTSARKTMKKLHVPVCQQEPVEVLDSLLRNV